MTEPGEQQPTQLDPGEVKDTGEGAEETVEVTPAPAPPPVFNPGSDESD